MTRVDDLVALTVKDFSNQSPIDTESGLRLTDEEYDELLGGWLGLTPAERQEYFGQLSIQTGLGPVGWAADDLYKAFTQSEGAYSYDEYREMQDALPFREVRKVESEEHIQRAQELVRLLLGRVATFTPGDYPDAQALNAAVEATRAARKEAQRLIQRYVSNDTAVGIERADTLQRDLGKIDEAMNAMRTFYMRGDRLAYVLGPNNPKAKERNPPPRLLEPHHVVMNGAHVRTMTLSELQALPASTKPIAPARPFTTEDLNSPPASHAQTYPKGNDELVVERICSFIEGKRTVGEWIIAVLKGIVALFTLPFDAIVGLVFGIMKVFGSKAHFEDVVAPTSFFAHKVPVPTYDELRHLTPVQAALLAQAIVDRYLNYDHSAVAKDQDGNFTQQSQTIRAALDILGAHDLLAGGRAVCQSMAEATQFVFKVIKGLQDPNDNKLVNASVQVISGFRASDNAGHAWCALIVVQPGGSLAIAHFDPTWADEDWTPRDDDYAFGTTTPGVPGGGREYFLHANLYQRTAPELTSIPAFLQAAVGAKSREEARATYARDLTSAEITKVAAELGKSPPGVRTVILDFLQRELTDASSAALTETLRVMEAIPNRPRYF